jgi:hypothetical protein
MTTQTNKIQMLEIGTNEWYSYIQDLWKQTVLAALQGGQSASEAMTTADLVVDTFNKDWARE